MIEHYIRNVITLLITQSKQINISWIRYFVWDYQESSKNIITWFSIKVSAFIWTTLEKNKSGPKTSYQSPFIFLNVVGIIIYSEIYNLAGFGVLIVVLKLFKKLHLLTYVRHT